METEIPSDTHPTRQEHHVSKIHGNILAVRGMSKKSRTSST